MFNRMGRLMKIYIIPHPINGFEFKWSCPRGELIVKRGLEQNNEIELVNSPKDADFYLLDYVPHENHEKTRKFTKQFEGNKLIVVDWIDEPDQLLADNYLLYFKRSMVKGDENRLKSVKENCLVGKNILPFSYALIEEFNFAYDDEKTNNKLIHKTPLEYNKRQIDIGCFLRQTCVNRATATQYTQYVVGELLKQSNNIQYYIGQVDGASRAIGGKCHFNRNYYKYLANTKINITCNPSGWEGDSRLWESLANGCLTFVDRMFMDYPNKLVDGEHVIYYDLLNPVEFIDKVVFYLNNQLEAERIANNGLAFAYEYHSPEARMKEVIGVL